MVMRSTVCHVEQAIRHQDETPLADALTLLRALLVLKAGIYKKNMQMQHARIMWM